VGILRNGISVHRHWDNPSLSSSPPWWPKMPPQIVNIGVIFGIVLIVSGALISLLGIWSVIPSPKLAILGMAGSVITLVSCIIWFTSFPQFYSETAESKPLRRLIAYGRLDLLTQWNGKVLLFNGYNIGINNAGDDTITSSVKLFHAYFDDNKVMAFDIPSKPSIVPQTMGYTCTLKQDNDILVPEDAKEIIVEFEVDYDTIPESGLRRSYRKISYPINWANGKNNQPLLEPRIINEWEK
jgi:hypothetical protein